MRRAFLTTNPNVQSNEYTVGSNIIVAAAMVLVSFLLALIISMTDCHIQGL